MKIPILSSKLSAVSATDLTDRYRHNPYVRSTVNIILLQVLLTIILVLVFGVALRFQQESTITAVGTYVDALLTGSTGAVTPLGESLRAVRLETLRFALTGLVLLTVFFGYLMARFALRPTRDSLQFQKRFIGNMAHELRTPLAIIKTNTEVALMDPKINADVRDVLETTSTELDRISETINNLLSFETMIRPSKVSLIELDLGIVAEAVTERHRPLAESRGIALSVDSRDEHLILGNSTGIEQVLTNLVKNALNYTPQHSGGEVRVLVRSEGDKVTVSVSDTGIGIAKEDLSYIFQPFYRADTSRARGVNGGTSGLGLAIVNEIVRAHHGKIFVRSVLNRGTTISVTFPKIISDQIRAEGARDEVEEVDLNLS
ncbi:MAG TPA: HAMP domain-containing sensor histidine kinase [Candidatus Paceibacterota bacterium]|jgi:signal transduction histidine kinase